MTAQDNEVMYKEALLADSGERISINDAKYYVGKQFFVCPECGAPMYPTFGIVQPPHFRHKGKPYSLDRYLHTNAEYTFYEEYNYCLNNHLPFYLDIELVRPCNMACVLSRDVDCSERKSPCHVDLTKLFSHISREHSVNVGGQIRRPDVLLSSDDGISLWVEIWVSHSDTTKREVGDILEIRIKEYADIEPLRRHQINCFSGKAFCYLRDSKLINKILDEETIAKSPVCPCDKYYYWEVFQTPTKKVLIRKFSDEIPEKRPGTLYLLVLMLNWSKSHNVRPENKYAGERLEMKRVKWFCENKLLSCLPGSKEFKDHKLETLRRYEYADDNLSLTDKELDDMLGHL